MTVLVRDEMNKSVKTLGPDDTVTQAAEKMAKYWMGSVIIVDGDKTVGILTERDILHRLVVSAKDPTKTKIREIMTKNVITIDESKPIDAAVKLMKANDIKKLPVTRRGKLVGIITTTDIIATVSEELGSDESSPVSLSSYRDLKVVVHRHAIDLKREVEKNQILTFVIPNELYPVDSISIIKAVTSVVPKTVFVTVNKPYFSIVKNLKSKGIKTDGLYFIDASTEEKDHGEGENFEKIRSPSDITDIMLAVGKCLQDKKYKALVFDSVSTLLTYHNEAMVSRFTHSLINKLRKYDVKGVFLCTKEDMNTNLMKNLNMLADYSVDIGKKDEIIQ